MVQFVQAINDQEPLLTVCIVTFNHAQFVGQAIDSVLSQETDFPFDIVIHDDCSTDGTVELLRAYQSRHPHRISLLLQSENQYRQGRSILTLAFAPARGKYIAVLEGDDYWSSNSKLSKQVAALEDDPALTLCVHQASVLRPDGSMQLLNPARVWDGEIAGLKEILAENLIPTASAVFVRDAFPERPDWAARLAMEDWPLWVLLASKGNVRCLPEIMSTYRVHPSGVWNKKTESERFRACLDFYYSCEYLAPVEIREHARIARIGLISYLVRRDDLIRAAEEQIRGSPTYRTGLLIRSPWRVFGWIARKFSRGAHTSIKCPED